MHKKMFIVLYLRWEQLETNQRSNNRTWVQSVAAWPLMGYHDTSLMRRLWKSSIQQHGIGHQGWGAPLGLTEEGGARRREMSTVGGGMGGPEGD